jgi:hypothetical protein
MAFLPVIYECFFNTTQLLEAEKELIYMIHLKAFLFSLDNVLLSKYMYVFSESQVIAHDVKPGFAICLIRWFSDGKCRYFLVSAPCFIYAGGCLIYIGVNCSWPDDEQLTETCWTETRNYLVVT